MFKEIADALKDMKATVMRHFFLASLCVVFVSCFLIVLGVKIGEINFIFGLILILISILSLNIFIFVTRR